MRKDKKIFWLVLISLFLLPYVFGAQINASETASSDAILVEENRSTAQETTEATSSGSIEADQTVGRSSQENLAGTFHGGGQTLQSSSASSYASGSNSASFSRHLMAKDFDLSYNPIDPTTIFRPSDTSAICLTTVSINATIEFRWYYRSNSSKTWIYTGYNWTGNSGSPGEYVEEPFAAWFNISGFWPGHHYPRAYKVDVHLDDSPSPAFSEYFEVTNGGLNSPRISEDVDVNGNPVNMKSRFTIGNGMEAYHYLRFDKIAYFNDNLTLSHNFTTVWIQPNGNTYETHSGNFTDYKDANVTWNYWEYNYTRDDYISIDSSTPVGNWTVEVYLDSYYFNNTWKPYGPVATTPFIVGDETVADWTFMVYLDADNDLEWAGIEIFLKMASVDPSSQVNIVVQMDRHPNPNRTLGYDDRYGNWNDAKRFNVTKDMTPKAGNAVEWLGEVNMGDSETLKDFVNWTINKYPANYYFLVIWDHGTGFVGVSYDFTDKDFLTLPELSQALSGLPVIMDVVFSDACAMSMTEIAYQIKDYANLLVGPEGLGYSPAPYDEYLLSLTSNPSMLPSAFAMEVVNDYMDWAEPIGQIQNATMSAIDLTKITSLTAAIDDFALNLKEKETPYLSPLLASHEQIILARNQTEGYQGPYAGQIGYYIDLYHFAQLINQSVLDEELQNTADQVMTALESIIIIEDNKNRPDSHGLSIFFPDEKGKYEDYASEYKNTTFAEDTLWDEFVKYHTSGYILTIETPYPDIRVEIVGKSNTTDASEKIRVFVSPGNYTVNVTTPIYNITEPDSREVFAQWNDNNKSNPRTLFVNGTLTLKAEYETQYKVTFDQSGVGVDFTGTVATINETEYNATDLPVSLWWDNDTTLSFAFQSPLEVKSNAKRYVWNYTSGLSYLQSDSRMVSTSGNVIGNYKTQYYLTLTTSPGVTTPSGEGWYHNGTDASISTDEFMDITPGASRYRFNGWTTTDMTEISDPNSPSTTVRMDKTKMVTANYSTQYYLTVISPYESHSPTSGWFEAGESINASATSPVSGPAGTRYVATRWNITGSVSASGTSTSLAFTIDKPSSITWTWKTQYLLTVRTDPIGLSPQPNASPPGPWYDNGTLVTCTAQEISGRVFDHWTVDGASWDPGVYTITVTMDRPYEATAHYVRASAWWETLFRPEILQVILGLVGIVLSVTFVGTAWIRTRRKRAVTRSLSNEISEVYSRLRMNPRECEEELYRLKNTILEGLTDGKITQESYDIMDKKIDKYMEELRKKNGTRAKR